MSNVNLENGMFSVDFSLDQESKSLLDKLVQNSKSTNEHVLRRAMSLFNIYLSLKQDYGNDSYLGVIGRDGTCIQRVTLANNTSVQPEDWISFNISLVDKDFIFLKELCEGNPSEPEVSSVMARGLFLYDKLEEAIQQGRELGIFDNNNKVARRIQLGNPAQLSVANQPVPA
jgi:hypothetical protein